MLRVIVPGISLKGARCRDARHSQTRHCEAEAEGETLRRSRPAAAELLRSHNADRHKVVRCRGDRPKRDAGLEHDRKDVTLHHRRGAREGARNHQGRARGEGTGAETFMSVAGAWVKRHVEKNGIRTRAEIERILAKYILPAWAGRDFVSIKRSDVTDLLDKIEDKHGPRMADCCLTVFSSIANWYASRHDSYSSPLVRGMKRAGGKEGSVNGF